MRKLMTAIFLLSSFSALADVKVTSFYFVNGNQHLAEICGVVEGATAPAFVNLKIDYRGNRPASYNAVTSADGKFCQAVITFRGEAQASVVGQATKTLAVVE